MARIKQTARKTISSVAGAPFQQTRSPNASYEPLERPAPMTAAQAQLIERENTLREMFVEDRNNAALADPYLDLIDVHANLSTFAFAPEDPDEAAVPKLLTKHRQVQKSGPSVVDAATFQARWRDFSCGVFEGMDWSNVFVAGGSVMACLMADENNGFKGSDIDIFVYGLQSGAQANEKIRHIHEVMKRNSKSNCDAIRTHRAITIIGEYPFRHVQIILKIYKSPAEILLGFDIDSCCAGFDGQRVSVAERCRRALNKGYNLVNMTRRSLTYETRLHKYSKRGFCVAVPDLDKANVKPSLFRLTPTNVQGLAKLLLFEFYEVNPRIGNATNRRYSSLIKRNRDEYTADAVNEFESLHAASDYADVFIPWGPGWYSSQIVRLLNEKDRANYFQQRFKPGGVQHRHLFATGIEGVINGTNCGGGWCVYCRQAAPIVGASGTNESSKYVSTEVMWQVESPVLQDFDKGRVRSLMTGSFHLTIEQDWLNQAYYSAGEARQDMQPHPLARLSPGQAEDDGVAAPSSSSSSSSSFGASRGGRGGGGFGRATPPAHPARGGGKVASFGSSQPVRGRGKGGPFSAQRGGRGGASVAAAAAAASTQYSTISGGAFHNNYGSAAAPAAAAPASASASTTQYANFGSFGGGSTASGPPTAAPTPVSTFSWGSSTSTPAQSALTHNPYRDGPPQVTGSHADLIKLSSSNNTPGGNLFGNNQSKTTNAFGTVPAGNSTDSVANEIASQLSGVSNPMSKCLLLAKILGKSNLVSQAEKGILKDLAIMADNRVLGVMDAYEIDRDVSELIDSAQRLARIAARETR